MKYEFPKINIASFSDENVMTTPSEDTAPHGSEQLSSRVETDAVKYSDLW